MEFLRLLESIRTPFFDELFQFITYFGQEIVLIAVICALYWCADKRFAYLLGLTYFSAGLCVQTLKITFRIPRPWILDPKLHPVESAVGGATGYSFPSGHTQGGTCLFAPAALHTKKLVLKLLCVTAFLLIGFSRMYLGVHTPKDVLVSMGISLLISCLLTKFSHLLLDSEKYTGLISCILMAAAVLVAIYAYIIHACGIIETKYASDCFKAAGAGLGFAVGFYIERTRLHFTTEEKTLLRQIIKFVVGILLALLIKEGTAYLLGSSLFTGAFKYFLTVLFIIVLYPVCFSKFRNFCLQ